MISPPVLGVHPPRALQEMDHRALKDSDSHDSEEEEEENEVVSFEDHMLDPAPHAVSTKDSPIHMLNTDDVMVTCPRPHAISQP